MPDYMDRHRLHARPGACIFRCAFRLILLCVFAWPASPVAAAPLSAPASIPAQPGAADLRAVLNDIGAQRAQVIEIQRELVKRQALSPQDGGQGEQDKALWIESWLRQKDLPSALRLDVPDPRVPAKIRPNLIIRYPGASERTLWVIGKLDVSPPGPLRLWTGSPWALRIEGDLLYGRGVSDNHQAITSGFILMDALARIRVKPPLGFGLILTSGDKTDIPPQYGIAAVAKSMPDLFRPGDLLLVNGFGTANGARIEVSEKGVLWLAFTVTGKPGHSSMPHEGVNALDAGAGFIVDLRGLHERFPITDPQFTPPVSTFVSTRMESAVGAANQIPGRFGFMLDCRLLHPYMPDQVQEAVRAMADVAEQRDNVSISMERLHSRLAVKGTAADAPVVAALARAIHAQTGKSAGTTGLGGVSQAYELRKRGLPAAVWSNTESRGFAANEHISIAAQLEQAMIIARILFDRQAASAAPPAAAPPVTPDHGPATQAPPEKP